MLNSYNYVILDHVLHAVSRRLRKLEFTFYKVNRLGIQKYRNMSSSTGIEYQTPIPENRYGDVIVHLRNNFFADEPLNKSVQLCKKGEPYKLLEDHSYKTLQDSYSIMAYDESTGELAGVILNGIVNKGDYKCEIEKLNSVTDEKYKEIFSFLFKTNESVDLFNKYNVDKIFELRIISVDAKFRRKGIANEFMKRSIEIANNDGFKVLKADATNMFTRKIAEHNGFQSIFEVCYSDYKSDDGEVIFKTEDPHNSLRVMVLCCD